MAAALCVLAATGSWAQQAAVKPLPSPDSARQQGQQQGQQQAQQQPLEWSAQEIELAQARCAVLLKGLDLVAVPATPWREGAECGTPAPMKLISIGKGQQVTLSPPVTLTCDMIAALYKWVQRDLQPLARKHLGAPLVRIEAMSAYSCRNAYGRAKSRLSEHGRVNALDIGAFATARGQAALVVADWGMTAREITAQIEAAKAEAAKAETARAAAKEMAKDQDKQAITGLRPTVTEPGHAAGFMGIPGISVQLPGSSSGQVGQFGLAPPSRLGGPKPPAAPGPALADGKMAFLHAAHGAACRIFGTVLGPEANKAHKNHFHVDMADRKGIAICE
jgi:hypothetical protein